jgi:hypothetical protein
MKAERKNRGVTRPVFKLGAKTEWMVNATPCALYSREKDGVPNLQEAAWVSGPVLMGMKNLAPTRFRTPDHQVAAIRCTDYKKKK